MRVQINKVVNEKGDITQIPQKYKGSYEATIKLYTKNIVYVYTHTQCNTTQ